MNQKFAVYLLKEAELTQLDPRKDPSGNYYDPTLVHALNLWDNYLLWVSLSTHLIAMYYGMNGWCGGSRIAIAYSC